MDPNSRRSQFSPFNARQTRTGPMSPTTRNNEPPIPKPSLPLDPKAARRPSTSRESSGSSMESLKSIRKIATNSKIRDREYRRNQLQLVFVNDALQQRLNGQTEAFDELVEQLNQNQDSPPDSASLRSWLTSLSHVISRLERQHSPLVQAIIDMKWTTMDSTFVKAYTGFIGMLISARPEYLSLVLSKIAHGFTHQSSLQALSAGVAEGSSRPLTRRMVYDRLHYMLSHLLELIPTLASSLQPLLIRNFPHKRHNQIAQVTYIRNLLRITQYCPELFEQILSTVIDRAIQIDVEIQVELEELEAVEATQSQEEIFDIDPFDTVVGEETNESNSDDEGEAENLSDISSDAGGGDDENKSPEPDVPLDTAHIQDMVQKLDAILKLVFDHFSRPWSPNFTPPQTTPSTPVAESPASPLTPLDALRSIPTSTDPERSKAIQRSQFYTLLSIFDRTIIRTFKSRYTQFLLFWFASLDSEYNDLFQGMLVSRALYEHEQPIVTRAAATAYIGSLVSRATFIDREGARKVAAVLCNALRDHLDAHDHLTREGIALPPGAQQHGLFYSVAQAVFLMFCFRWRDLMMDESGEEEVDASVTDGDPAASVGRKWMSELGIMQRVINSSLNPLKICSTNVVLQFARVAHHVGFIYCYTILESNKRTEVRMSSASASNSSSGESGTGQSLHASLNTFFPFDPFNLPRTCSYIHPVYRDWTSVAIDESDDENGDEDEDEDEEDEGEGASETEELGGLSSITKEAREATDGLGESFGGMSISPIRPPPTPSTVPVI